MDGKINVVWLGDGFGNKRLDFFNDLCDAQEEFMLSLEPFATNEADIQFQRKLAKGNLNCVNSGFEVTTCNWAKAIQQGTINGVTPDIIHIFSYGNGFGTGNGGISITGVGTLATVTQPWACPYYTREPKISMHEMGHAMGLGHKLVPEFAANIMSQATNGGCEIGNAFHADDIITLQAWIDLRKGLVTANILQ